MIVFLKYVFVFILIYLYIHNPLFFFANGIGSIKFLYPLLFLLVFKRCNIIVFANRDIIFSYVIIVIYSFIITAFGGEAIFIYTSFLSLIEVVFLSSILVFICTYNNISLYRTLLYVSIASSLISLMCFLLPIINEFVKYELLILNDYLSDNNYRGFGISESLTYSYGIIQAVLFFIGLVNILKYRWYIPFMPFIVFSIMINARIGLVVLFVGIILLLLLSWNLRKFISFVLMFLIFFIFFQIIDFENINEESYNFVMQFFYEVSDFVFGTNIAKYSTANALFVDMFILPETLTQWCIGRGESLYLSNDKNTDVGYLLQLNYGGIMYVFLLMIMVYKLFVKNCIVNNRCYTYFFLLVIFICNTKGSFILNSGGFRLLVLISLYEYNNTRTFHK